MGQESRYFDASDEAKAFIKQILVIDSLTSAVDTGWPREEMFEEFHGRAERDWHRCYRDHPDGWLANVSRFACTGGPKFPAHLR